MPWTLLYAAASVIVLKHTWLCYSPAKTVNGLHFQRPNTHLSTLLFFSGNLCALSNSSLVSLLQDSWKIFTPNPSPLNKCVLFFVCFLIFHQFFSLPSVFLLQPFLHVGRSYSPFTTKLKRHVLCEALVTLVDRVCDSSWPTEFISTTAIAII